MIYTHAYLAALARRMVETDATAEEIAYAVEKPWKHHDELSPDAFAAQPPATDRDALTGEERNAARQRVARTLQGLCGSWPTSIVSDDGKALVAAELVLRSAEGTR